MKKEINVFEHAAEIMTALNSGVLLTTKAGNKVDSMTIGWGMLGIEWGKPIFTVFVREHRFTTEQLKKNGEFTINIPVGNFDKKILGFCGSKSGRNIDKVKELNLTLVDPNEISVPAIKELPLTLECRVIYKQAQDPKEMTEENKAKFHPQDVPYTNPMANQDYHTAYYGEIVSAYIVE